MKTQTLEAMAKQLAQNYTTQKELMGQGGAFDTLFQKTLQAALDAELTNHLGYKKHTRNSNPNSRNGYTKKTLQSRQGSLTIRSPRDRESSFEPQIVKKNQTRFQELDHQIIALYAKGLTTAQIQDQLKEIYGVDCSTSLISTVTHAVLEEVKIWQSRALETIYPIVYLDCLYVKIRDERQIVNKAIYLALAINKNGKKELLGMWVGQKESAKFWLGILTELKNRGLEDILIICIDNLQGFKEAIEVVYPNTKIQLCIVHMIRNSLKYVSYKDRKALAAELKSIYKASTVEGAKLALDDFSVKWKEKYPYIAPIWQKNWEFLSTYFDYPPAIKKAIYTTNAIESLNMTLRMALKNRRVFPNEESALKVLYLALERISKRWTMPIVDWSSAINRFITRFGAERMRVLT